MRLEHDRRSFVNMRVEEWYDEREGEQFKTRARISPSVADYKALFAQCFWLTYVRSVSAGKGNSEPAAESERGRLAVAQTNTHCAQRAARVTSEGQSFQAFLPLDQRHAAPLGRWLQGVGGH